MRGRVARATRVATRVACGVVLAGGWAGAGAQGNGIPDRPERIRFEDAPFEVPDPRPLRWELSNGVPVFVAADATVPLFSISLAVPVGDRLDPPDRVGLASLTAAMMRRGGAGDRDADAFDEAADYLGIEIDSLGGATRSGVILEGSSRVLEEALDLFADLVLQPRFEAARVERALENLRGSLATRNDDPLAVLDREWRALLWGRDDPRARVVLPAHLAAIDSAALAAFHRERWGPRGAVIAISGDVEAGKVVAALDRRLGRWEGSPAPAVTPAAPDAPEATAAESATEPAAGIWWFAHPSPQGKLMLGHEGDQRRSWDDPDAWALTVMAEVFGGAGAVSRVRSRLRAEESLVYRVRASYGLGAQEPGTFEVFLEVEPAAAVAAVRSVIDEIERLRREPVPDVELDLAKRSLIDVFPLLFDSPESVAGRFAEDALLGRPHAYWSQYRARTTAVTATDVRRAARRFLHPDRLRILWVGPEPAAKEWEVLGLGPPRPLPARDPATMQPLGSGRAEGS
ncbi:MAG TPA: pitrilysin family protein [Thermoanaerobaculia bacterium]|nr:pitrilysin family protein [Thermoanaerobaculia bacterium]